MPQAQTRQREMPLYRLLAPCYLEDDTLHGEGEEIIYLGIPNEEMEPLNDPAREASTAYLEHLDDAARAVSAARNMPFMGRAALLDQAIEHAQKELQKQPMVLPAYRGEAPVRPDLATPAQRLQREMRDGKKVLGSKPPTMRKDRGHRGSPVVLGNAGGPAGDPVLGRTPLVGADE